MVMGQISDRELHEECGVFGVFGVKDAASDRKSTRLNSSH